MPAACCLSAIAQNRSQCESSLSPHEPNIPARCGFFFDSAQIRRQCIVIGNAQFLVFESRAQRKGQFFFDWSGECDRFDLVPKPFDGSFRHLHSQACAIETPPFHLRQCEQAMQFKLLFGKGFVLQLNPHPIPNHVPNLFAHIENGQILFPSEIRAQIKRVRAARQIIKIFERVRVSQAAIIS
jgi:hypothetical protein